MTVRLGESCFSDSEYQKLESHAEKHTASIGNRSTDFGAIVTKL